MEDGKMSKSIHIFCCYTHTDREFLDALKKHLQPLLRRGFIDLWSDTDIGPGMPWEAEIKVVLQKRGRKEIERERPFQSFLTQPVQTMWRPERPAL